VAGVVIGATFVWPHWAEYRFYNWQTSVARKPEYSLARLISNASWLPVVSDLFTSMWIVLAGAAAGVISTLSRWRNAAPSARLFVWWLAIGLAELIVHGAGEERYYVVLIPAINPRHVKELPRDFMYAGLLYSLPLAAVAGASAFGWMVAFLRGPDIVAGYITAFAGTDGMLIMFLLVAVFVIVGDFIDAVPAIIIFMPIINKLTEVGNLNPLHMGVVIITTLVFGLITPPYGLSLLVASKYVGVGFGRAVVRSLPLYVVFFLTIAFTVAFPKVVLWLPKQLLPESVGCFKAPSGTGYICPP